MELIKTMRGLNFAALQYGSSNRGMDKKKDSDIWNGLLINRRLMRSKKKNFLAIGFEFTSNGIRNIESASYWTTGLSKEIVLSKPESFTFRQKCKILYLNSRDKKEQSKVLLFKLTHHISDTIMRFIGCDKSAYFGLSMGYSDFYARGIYYFSNQSEMSKSSTLTKDLKSFGVGVAVRRIREVYDGQELFDESEVREILGRLEFVVDNEKLEEMYSKLENSAIHKARVPLNYKQLNSVYCASRDIRRKPIEEKKESTEKEEDLVSEQNAQVDDKAKPESEKEVLQSDGSPEVKSLREMKSIKLVREDDQEEVTDGTEFVMNADKIMTRSEREADKTKDNLKKSKQDEKDKSRESEAQSTTHQLKHVKPKKTPKPKNEKPETKKSKSKSKK